jgi:hypothetical protein
MGTNIVALRHLLSLIFEQVRRMRDRRVRAHRGGDYRCFRQHCLIFAGLTGCSYMQLNGHCVVSATATVINGSCNTNTHRGDWLLQPEAGSYLEVPLSSIDQDIQESGEQAVRLRYLSSLERPALAFARFV